MNRYCLLWLLLVSGSFSFAQNRYELNSGWYCNNIQQVKVKGEVLSRPSYKISRWLPATVPGTVLTTLLNNKKVPDPFYGMNNERIPDIYNTGRDYYTYWFVKDFMEKPTGAGEEVWLQFRGVNYSCDVYLNGRKLNAHTHYGMYLRQQYNITGYLSKDGSNRLAVIVYPPDPVGNANGGQGGDGTIAHNVTHQYVAGWDWIQPIRDRNTGIWDKVTIERTHTINLENPHVMTLVPGVRQSGGQQAPAVIKVSAEVENPSGKDVQGIVQYELEGETIQKAVTIPAGKITTVQLPDHTLQNPKLWWPNGYGEQPLYTIRLQFVSSEKELLDEEKVRFGVRELQTAWNAHTRSMEVLVNGQKIFIKGGNWIISDAMLRFSPERYDAEIRFHRDMNLNLIRIWGGAITERPEFYDACDRYGLLVMQDFWNSGDCNGRWLDPMKKEDQWTRRQYPDDHGLFLRSAADQVKMIRNHPSLALWCGGNEITPTDDILFPLKDSIVGQLDGTRYFIDFSNSDSMSYNALGGNGDGPYGIQDIKTFYAHRTFPFNSEVGSVGVGDYASLKRFLPEENLADFPGPGHRPDSVWTYHKYIGYDKWVDPYGAPKDVKDFANKVQLINFDQYRALMEGFTAHMWDWYTGVIIWKTQNPWTALRGQMYDYYLDPNACLYGLHHGSEPLHVMFNPADSMVMIANNTFTTQRNLMLQVSVYDMAGHDSLITQVFSEIGPTNVKNYLPVGRVLSALGSREGLFLSLRLLNVDQKTVSDNLYWLPDAHGQYSGLQHISAAKLQVKARLLAKGKMEVQLRNPAGGPVAFFNRLSVTDPVTKKRILPSFYSDNYISVLPGEQTTVTIDFPSVVEKTPLLTIEGWNVPEQQVTVEK